MSLFNKDKKQINLPDKKESADLVRRELEQLIYEIKRKTRTEAESIIDQAMASLTQNLQEASKDIVQDIKQSAQSATQQEFSKLKQDIKQEYEKALKSFTQTYQEAEKQREKLQQESEKEAQEYKKELVEKFENNLNKSISDFLAANLGDALDLNTQSDYIFDLLEEHKEQLKADILAR